MKYVIYRRDESGLLTRTHEPVVLTKQERVAEYPHRTRLLGWPETSVFWRSESGRSVGVAPLY
jgi:hypothetical protein